jgi:hypothetical protein
MGTWTNADGLYIRYNTNEAAEKLGGMENNVGNRHTLTFNIEASDFAAVGTNTILDSVYLPNNAYIEGVQIFVETAFAGSTGTLDIGLIRRDRTTEVDYDGLDAVVALSALEAKDFVECDGVLIRTRLSNSAFVTVRNNTADYSAGKATIRVYYSV